LSQQTIIYQEVHNMFTWPQCCTFRLYPR